MNPRIAKLIKIYQEDNKEEAIISLWEDFQPLVIATLNKFYVEKEQRTDMSQEAFIKLLECAKKYDRTQKVPFESFYKIQLTYWFMNHIRKRAPDLPVVDHDWQNGISMTNLLESTMGKAQDQLDQNEVTRAINKGLETLTQKQYQAVTLFYLAGLPLGDVAKKMGSSYKMAFRHKDAGLKNLKKHMKKGAYNE